MANFAFRIRFDVFKIYSLMIDGNQISLPGIGGETVYLKADGTDGSIKEASQLVLFKKGYCSAQDAEQAGRSYQDFLIRSLAKLRIGADFGNRKGKGGLYLSALKNFSQGSSLKLLNDELGLTVYEADIPTSFARLGIPTLTIGHNQDRWATVFVEASTKQATLQEEERLAYHVFSLSFQENSMDARLLLLMMAVELLLKPEQRSQAALDLVDGFIRQTKEATRIEPNERASILGSLQWLRQESISQAGKRLANERLSGKQYMEMEPGKFFKHCYDIRSSLTHGRIPMPSRDEVGTASAQLEVFVSDLLAGPLINV